MLREIKSIIVNMDVRLGRVESLISRGVIIQNKNNHTKESEVKTDVNIDIDAFSDI